MTMGLFDDINKRIKPPAAKLTLDMLLRAADHVAKHVPAPDPSYPAGAIDANEWERCKRLVQDPPPVVKGIRTSHRVPYGRHFKQWDTNGQLWVWANRGEVEDLPHVEWNGIEIIAGADILGPSLVGVPVYNE